MERFRAVAAGLAFLLSTSTAAEARDLLRGSPRSMQRQHGVAVQSGYRFAETPRDAEELLAAGELVEVPGNSGPAHNPLVHAEVEAVAARHLAQTTLTCANVPSRGQCAASRGSARPPRRHGARSAR